MIIIPQSDFGKGQSSDIESSCIEQFLEIFSSRWNFIIAESSESIGNKASWKTINKFNYRYIRKEDSTLANLKPKLEDELLYRMWQSSQYFIGLGFDKNTRYLILDIDAGSIYHPNKGKSLEDIKRALEDIGLVSPLIIQSSYSGGLHVYYPLPKPVKSFALGWTVTSYLKEKGFSIADGTLEILPNPKKKTSIYKRCRLPLQEGSFILDHDYQIIGNSLKEFIGKFEFSAKKQDIEQLETSIKYYQKKCYSQNKSTDKAPKRTGKLQEMISEYQTLLEKGFQSNSQTNEILLFLGRVGRLVEQLGGKELYQFIFNNITKLPNYKKYCNHQNEMSQRCLDVARCTERHYPLKVIKEDIKPLPEPKENNQAKWDNAARRIKDALDQIQKNQETFEYKTHLLKRIVEIAKCSLTTIKKHWDSIQDAVRVLLKPLGASVSPPEEDKRTLEGTTQKKLPESDSERLEENPNTESVCNPSDSNTFSGFCEEKPVVPGVCNPSDSNTFSGFCESLYTKDTPFVSYTQQKALLRKRVTENRLQNLLEKLRLLNKKTE